MRICFDAHNLNVLSNKELTFHVILLSFLWSVPSPVPVRHFPRPFRSIHFGDVSEAIRGELAGKSLLRSDHVTQNELAARSNEA